MINFYVLLQVHESSSVQEIKRAYHKLALIHHPDKRVSSGNADTSISYNSLKTAYETLVDTESRAAYDTARRRHVQARFCIDTIGPEDLTQLDGESWSYDCRCGDTILVDTDMKGQVVPCSSCSLSFKIVAW